MSTIFPITCKCGLCGAASEQRALGSSNRLGSPDLDMRPPEMLRSTMAWWLQECPVCGYVSGDLSQLPDIDAKWFVSDEYFKMAGRRFKDPLTGRFYKYYLINMKTGQMREAFFAALHAAWVCDDARDFENAQFCRMTALFVLQKYMDMVPDRAEREDLMLIKADILRRAGMFDELIAEYEGKTFSTYPADEIIAFQIGRARLKDADCYTVADAAGDGACI